MELEELRLRVNGVWEDNGVIRFDCPVHVKEEPVLLQTVTARRGEDGKIFYWAECGCAPWTLRELLDAPPPPSDTPPPPSMPALRSMSARALRDQNLALRDYLIEQWEDLLKARAEVLRRSDDPTITRADVEELLLTVIQEPDWAPPTGCELSQPEIEGSVAKVAGLLFPPPTPPAPARKNGKLTPDELYGSRLPVSSLDAWAKIVADQRGYAWAGFIKEGCTMLLSGLMGSGKSTLAMNLTRAWSLGEPFLGRETKPSKTLVVVSPKEYEAWAETLGFWQVEAFLVPSSAAHFAKHDDAVSWFEYCMEKYSCRTFVLDTVFDFFGMPPNSSGDQNRIVMNEQTPLLECVRDHGYAGLVLGHQPKSEAQALVPRDPEESFGGHTAWAAQHRMRGTIRRKAEGFNTFCTGRGGYGDEGILSSNEQMLLFDPNTRLVSLGGPWGDYLGIAALPSVLLGLRGWMSRSELEKAIGKSKNWTLAGLKHGIKQGLVKPNGKKGRAGKYALANEPMQDELF